MTRAAQKLIPDTFDPVPSAAWIDALAATAVDELDESAGALGVLIAAEGPLPPGIAFDRDALARAGFEAKPGQALALPQPTGPVLVLVGLGGDPLTTAALRTAAAVFARAAARHARIGLRVDGIGEVDASAAGRALIEGIVLSRYRYSPLKQARKDTLPEAIELRVGDGADRELVADGIAAGLVAARAACLARDLANTPPGHLTAADFGEVAVQLGAAHGFGVELFDRAQLIALGCGGLLGVNAGSAEEPRMVKLTYAGTGGGKLAMVGKGIMYDSGGISLKPSDPMHLLMKMDMGGAAAILGAFTAFAAAGVRSEVTAWLMCTDNMPSGSAYKLGDVLTARGGTTVEVKNTDAEGRLVMMDGLVLATETEPDAIVDIATLTGAALMALGQLTAALFGNDQPFVDQVKAAADASDEQVWQLPLERTYRKQLDSDVADLSNLGGKYAGATTAALFLDHFVAGIPWAHLDIAGTMQSDADDAWRSAGATGFGARLLLDLAERFVAPSA
ncbi:leucyl aminopeptidase [Agromyces sp. MMS24-JH15]|uniref:leucyl aminopeptidase n=1 Tax=Agromyces sp. MMS24-JH15 TaxID=3243765 RepID=UPI00374A463E